MGILLTDGRATMPYVHQEFPKHVYHPAHPGFREVANEAAWLALGPGWGHPSDQAPVVAEPESVAADAAPVKRGRPRKDAD